jgi:hypothetical protein
MEAVDINNSPLRFDIQHPGHVEPYGPTIGRADRRSHRAAHRVPHIPAAVPARLQCDNAAARGLLDFFQFRLDGL